MSTIPLAPSAAPNHLKFALFLCFSLLTSWAAAGEYQSLIEPGQNTKSTEPEALARLDASKGQSSVTNQSALTHQSSLSNQSTLSNQSALPEKPAAIDSQGRQLSIPHAAQPGMEFSGRDYVDHAKKQGRRSDNNRPKRRVSSKTVAARSYVADDPNCRWLDNRMGQLEKLLTSRGAGEHHGDELKARQKEWRCLKCGSNGPRQGDHDRCMYRR